MNMNKYDIIIWDFNGTIIDDLELCREIINRMLQQYQLPLLSKAKYRNIFRFPIEQYYNKTGVTAFASFAFLAKRFNEEYAAGVKKLNCFPDVKEAIITLYQNNIKQLVLSASRKDDLVKQMTELGLKDYFSDLLGISDILASGKEELALKWLHDNNAVNKRILVIGDTEHDFEIAQLLAADCLLIARGHVSEKRLIKTGATVVKDLKNFVADITASN